MGQCSVVVQRCPHPQKFPWQILVLYNLAQGPDTAQKFPGQSISNHASKMMEAGCFLCNSQVRTPSLWSPRIWRFGIKQIWFQILALWFITLGTSTTQILWGSSEWRWQLCWVVLGSRWGDLWKQSLGKWQNSRTHGSHYNSRSFFLENFSTPPKANIVRLYVGPTAPPGGQFSEPSNLASLPLWTFSTWTEMCSHHKKRLAFKKEPG